MDATPYILSVARSFGCAPADIARPAHRRRYARARYHAASAMRDAGWSQSMIARALGYSDRSQVSWLLRRFDKEIDHE